jgi:hypothetical protein
MVFGRSLDVTAASESLATGLGHAKLLLEFGDLPVSAIFDGELVALPRFGTGLCETSGK